MLFPILRSIYRFILPESNASLVILMLFCTILTEFCGLLAQTINGIRSYVGPFGKSDRALIFGLWGWPLPFIHSGCNGIIFYGALLQFCFSGLRLIVVGVCSWWVLKDNAGKISGNTFRVVNFSNADKPFSGMAVTGEKGWSYTTYSYRWGIVICFSLVISGPRWMTLTFLRW